MGGRNKDGPLGKNFFSISFCSKVFLVFIFIILRHTVSWIWSFKYHNLGFGQNLSSQKKTWMCLFVLNLQMPMCTFCFVVVTLIWYSLKLTQLCIVNLLGRNNAVAFQSISVKWWLLIQNSISSVKKKSGKNNFA